MRFEPTTLRLACVVTALLIGVASSLLDPAAADIDFGVRGGYYTDAEEASSAPISSCRSRTPVVLQSQHRVRVRRPGRPRDAQPRRPLRPRHRQRRRLRLVGRRAGDHLPRRRRAGRNDDDETDLGLNLLGGIGWQLESFVPYFQGKAILADDSEAVLAVGVRF